MSPSPIAANRTGLGFDPGLAKQVRELTGLTEPSSPGGAEGFAELRATYADRGGLGPVPLPGARRGAAGGAARSLKGERLSALLDKLGERLAFERTAVRLYDVLIAKHEIQGSFAGGPSRAELGRIRWEELSHFQLLWQAISALGGDPTAQTPAADLVTICTRGIVEVLADPRTELRQALDALLIAELADGAGFEGLCRLAEAFPDEELARRCRIAISEEQAHLAMLHGWLLRGQEPSPQATLRLRQNGSARRGRR